MKRPFVTFMAVVVVPAAVAIAATLVVAQQAWDELGVQSSRRVARLALGSLEQDLGEAVDTLLALAEPLPEVDATLPAVQAALAGDTVSGIDRAETGFDVFVLFPVAGEPGALRFGRSSLRPSALVGVAEPMEARLAYFGDDEVWSRTDDPPDESSVTRARLLEAAASPDGVRAGSGVLLGLNPRPGSIPRISVLAESADSDRTAVSGPVRLVLGLILLFSALAGWILLVEGRAGTRSPQRSATALVSLSLVPALATLALLVHVHRTFSETARDDISRDLTRAVAIVERLGMAGSPDLIHDLTGFPSARLESGVVVAGTIEGNDSALAAVPSPPPSFTTSGTVETTLGSHLYVARRLDRSASLLTLAPIPEALTDSMRIRALVIGILLTAWLIGVAVFVLARRGRPAGGPEGA